MWGRIYYIPSFSFLILVPHIPDGVARLYAAARRCGVPEEGTSPQGAAMPSHESPWS